jgi:curved DNA-binding protein CbpA
VLGVKPEATGAQIKIAYFQLAKSYHPDAVPADAPPQVRKLCAEIFAKVSEAWSVLGTDASRATYKEQLASGGTSEVDVGRIFEAERLFETGTMFVKGRNYAEGLKKFEEAIALNPDEAEFEMWKAWCEFVLADDKRKKFPVATAGIDAALRRNPRCAQGYIFLGQMAKIAGDLGLAERQLRRGLEVAPENTDLKRELKYLRK